MALASSVTASPAAPARRAACRCGTSAASAPATCRCALQRAAPRGRPRALLQRVGQRVRQQAADRVVLRRRRSALDLGRRDQAARRVVHQHPVVLRGAAARAGRPGRWRPCWRAWRRRTARPGPRKPALRSTCGCRPATPPPARVARRCTGAKASKRVRDHRLAGDAARTAWARRVPARLPRAGAGNQREAGGRRWNWEVEQAWNGRPF